MSRISSMARFAEPDEKEPQVIAFCCSCDEPLRGGAEVVKIDIEYLCDMDCLKEYYDINYITLGDE